MHTVVQDSLADSSVYQEIKAEAQAVLAEAPETQIAAAGLRERAALATSGERAPERSILTPTYLTDLGGRSFADPGRFYSEHVKILPGILGRPRSAGDDAGTVSLEDQGFADLLDLIVVFWGDYDLAEQLVLARGIDPHRVDSVSLLTYSANLVGVRHPSVAVALLDRAYDVAPTPASRFVGALRAAAVVLKRQGRFEEARQRLEAIRRNVESPRFGDASPQDVATMFAMTWNLEALSFVREGRLDDAADMVERAVSVLQVDGLSVLARSEALRYRTQIVGNCARLAWLMGRKARAVELWRENVADARSDDLYSLSETLFGRAYGHYLSGDFTEARDDALEAAELIAREAAPNRLEVCRKVRLAAAARLGDSATTRLVVESLASDPLGIGLERLASSST